jgi:hypothetical protein
VADIIHLIVEGKRRTEFPVSVYAIVVDFGWAISRQRFKYTNDTWVLTLALKRMEITAVLPKTSVRKTKKLRREVKPHVTSRNPQKVRSDIAMMKRAIGTLPQVARVVETHNGK